MLARMWRLAESKFVVEIKEIEISNTDRTYKVRRSYRYITSTQGSLNLAGEHSRPSSKTSLRPLLGGISGSVETELKISFKTPQSKESLLIKIHYPTFNNRFTFF